MGECVSSPLPVLPPSPSFSPPSSAGEAHRIFEMCFDHQSSQKALILYWPEMKGIRCRLPPTPHPHPVKGYLDLQVMFCLFIFFHPLKRGCLDIIKRRKASGFEAFQLFCWRKRVVEQRVRIHNFHESLSSASFRLPSLYFCEIWLLLQSRYKC